MLLHYKTYATWRGMIWVSLTVDPKEGAKNKEINGKTPKSQGRIIV